MNSNIRWNKYRLHLLFKLNEKQKLSSTHILASVEAREIWRVRVLLPSPSFPSPSRRKSPWVIHQVRLSVWVPRDPLCLPSGAQFTNFTIFYTPTSFLFSRGRRFFFVQLSYGNHLLVGFNVVYFCCCWFGMRMLTPLLLHGHC